MLVQCAWAASRKKGSYDKAQFNRLRSKRGPKKAICAVAASMLTAIHHMLKDGTEHRDLGADHFDHRVRPRPTVNSCPARCRRRSERDRLSEPNVTAQHEPLAGGSVGARRSCIDPSMLD